MYVESKDETLFGEKSRVCPHLQTTTTGAFWLPDDSIMSCSVEGI